MVKKLDIIGKFLVSRIQLRQSCSIPLIWLVRCFFLHQNIMKHMSNEQRLGKSDKFPIFMILRTYDNQALQVNMNSAN